MKYELFKEVVLLKDIPGKKLKKGDVATIVEHHPSTTSEDGYSLEVFNALGDAVAVVTVSESEIETLKERISMRWNLQQHGDSFEKQWWPKIKLTIPNYEVFWQKHVAPLTMRVIQEQDIGLRPSIPKYLADIATANYGLFIHLAQSHDELENKSRIVEPIGFYSFYSHLYTIVDAMVERFLSATKKVLEKYNIITFPKTRQNERFRVHDKSSLNRDLTKFNTRLDKYRGLLIHDYPFIFANGKVPRPEKAKEYNSLEATVKIRQNPSLIVTDFEEIIPRCKTDLGELEQLLNQIWDVVLKEFDSLPEQYKEDINRITKDDEAFLGNATFLDVQMHASHSLNITNKT